MNPSLAKHSITGKPNSFGGITLMILVTLVVFIVIISTILQLVGRQSHDIAQRRSVMQLQSVAEAGVARALWVLDPAGGGKEALDVSQSQSSAAVVTTIFNSAISALNAVNFIEYTDYDPAAKSLAVRSIAINTDITTGCPVVEADVHAFVSSGYDLTFWQENQRDCVVGNELGCGSPQYGNTGRNAFQPDPYCPIYESGCHAYPIFSAPSTDRFKRVVKSALTLDDCETFDYGNPTLPRRPQDVYWIGVEENNYIRYKVTSSSSNFTPTVSIWGPTGNGDCVARTPSSEWPHVCQVPAGRDHYLVLVSSNVVGQTGEYVLTMQYD